MLQINAQHFNPLGWYKSSQLDTETVRYFSLYKFASASANTWSRELPRKL